MKTILNRIILFALLLILFTCKPFDTFSKLSTSFAWGKPEKDIPKAVNGVLDLTKWNFDPSAGSGTNGTINLDGEWEFYWNELIEPMPHPVGHAYMRDLQDAEIKYISVPGSWNHFEVNGKPVGGKGYATYRLKVILGKPIHGLTLKTEHVGTAYKLWVNGNLLADVGKVSKEESNANPGYLNKLFLLSESFRELDIIIESSNYHDRNGGIWRPFVLGTNETIANKTLTNHFLNFFLFGSLLVMGIYHLGLYSLRKKDPSALWFGLFSILISLRPLLVGESILYSLFSSSWILLNKIEYLTVYAGLPLFVNFINCIFTNEIHNKVKKWINSIGFFFSFLVIFFPPYYYTQTLKVYQIFLVTSLLYVTFVLLKAAQKGMLGAKIFLAGWIFFFITIVNDVLHSQLIINTAPLFPFGFFIFIFSQAFVLSMRFSGAFNQAEELSSDLQRLTQNLENKIAEAIKEIEDLNQFTYLVNSLSKLDDIFVEVSEYVYNKYNIVGTWLFLPDEKRENLYTHKAYSYRKISDEKYNFLMNKKIPLIEKDGGMLYLTFQRKKPFYLRKISKFEFAIDREFVEALSVKSFLYVPLVRKNKSVGIFVFSNLEEEMKLSRKEIRKLSNLCSQIAGAVDTNHLLQQVDKARKEIEKQKDETEDLNKLIKSLNEDLNVKHIMQKVIEFVNKNFGIQYYALYSMNSPKTHIQLLDVSFPDYVIQEDRDIIKNQNIPIQNVAGAHALAIKAKKLFYFKKLRKSGVTKEEAFVIEKYRMQSFLVMPLLLNNEPIGILGFSNSSEKMQLSNEDITKLSILGEQLAGIIYGSNLFNEVQVAKEQADIERGIALLAQQEAELERGKSEKLLLNILPSKVADELKEKGSVEPVFFENATIMFTDFKGFTQIAEGLTPQELIKELDGCFSIFDQITERNNLEKLKTIGDSYMCAGGIPKINLTHAIDSCLAALEIQSLMYQVKEVNQMMGKKYWELRLGIHSGPVMAGVIGERKFAYDVWGDTVNTASRMESSGNPGKINISHATYELVKHVFDCEYRGEVAAKNKGMVKMYYLNRIKLEFSKDEFGIVPNGKFWDAYKGIRTGLDQKLVKNIKKLLNEIDLFVGLQVIDVQHLWLYYLILELEEINVNKDSSVVYRDLKQISNDLQEFVDEHFRLEETLMEECKFVQISSHIRMHNYFSEFIRTKIKDFHSINIDEIQVIIDYLKSWLQNHILIEDKLLCNFIKSNDFNSEKFFQKIIEEKIVTISKYQSDLYNLIINE